MKNLPWDESHLLLPSPYQSGNQCTTDISGKINYQFNSNGYRTDEWDSITWSDSVIVLGCSHVLGVGVNVEHSLPGQLKHMLNCPVINLGYCASSMTVQLYNSLALVKQGIRPRAVILVAPELTRLAYFTWSSPVHMVPTNTVHMSQAIQRSQWLASMLTSHQEQLPEGIDDCYKGWIHHEPNAEVHGALQWASITHIWQHVPFYTFTVVENSNSTRWIDADCLPKYTDRAADGLHAGPKTIAAWATEIVNKVCLL